MQLHNLLDTWNDAGVPWVGLGLDVTGTAYQVSGSRLFQLKLDGTARFFVGPLGQGYFATSLGVGTDTPTHELQVAGDVKVDDTLFVTDTDFNFSALSGNPIFALDAGDYLLFERGADTFSIIIGSTPVATFSPSVGVSIQTTVGQRLLEVGAPDSSRPGYRTVEVIN